MNSNIYAITIMMVLFVGCKNKTEEQEHLHGSEPLSYTRYSDKTEIFVEFKPLVVGSVSKFAAHFTTLGDNFIPLTEGAVTVSLIVDGKGIKQTLETPNEPGIYHLALKPITAGAGKLIFSIKTKNFTDQFIIDSVKVYPDETKGLTEQVDDGDGSDIAFLKEQAWKVVFANAPVTRQSFSNIIKTSGQIISAPGDEIILTAKASGIVLFTGNKTIIGSEVKAGSALFTIASGDITEENIDANYKSAKANFEKSKTEYDRARELVKDKIVSEKEFQEARLKYEIAQTSFDLIAKNYSANGQTISSSINGFIKSILVSGGQFVKAGTPLATISKNKKLVLQANVSQKYFGKLAAITSANFKTPESEVVYSTEELNGKIISYGKSAVTNSPFIPITFEIDNSKNLIPGSVVEIFLKSFPIPDALVIPASSLIEEQGNFFVYVQTGGESFQKREIKLGASDGINVQLLSGVAAGERVVIKGAYQIKLSTASGTMPSHGHDH